MSHPDSDQPPEVDEFAQYEQRNAEFRERVAQEPEIDILGLVGASGAGGAGGPGRSSWRLVVFFDGWRPLNGDLQAELLHAELPIDEFAARDFMGRIAPWQIMRVRGRVAMHGSGVRKAALTEIIDFATGDAGLAERAVEQQRPVKVEHPRFGTLTLDRRFNWYEAQVLWCGSSAELTLHADEGDSIERSLRIAEAVFDDESRWHERALRASAEELLDLRNSEWREEHEPEIGRSTFEHRMKIESIEVNDCGRITFWFDDDDLFYGHSIEVRCTLERGPFEAVISG